MLLRDEISCLFDQGVELLKRCPNWCLKIRPPSEMKVFKDQCFFLRCDPKCTVVNKLTFVELETLDAHRL